MFFFNARFRLLIHFFVYDNNLAADEAHAVKVVRRAGEVTDLKSGGGGSARGADAVFPGQASDSGEKPSNFSLALRQSWSSDTGRCVDASPVLLVHGGATAFIGSHSHRFQALELTSGSCLWERVLGGRIESSAAVSLCGSLVVVGQCRLFIGDWLSAFFLRDWSSEELDFICFHISTRLLRRLRVFPVRDIWEDPVDVSDWRCGEELSSCGSPHWSGDRWVT